MIYEKNTIRQNIWFWFNTRIVIALYLIPNPKTEKIEYEKQEEENGEEVKNMVKQTLENKTTTELLNDLNSLDEKKGDYVSGG